MLHGDVLDCLRSLPDNSVHMCVTSPPYWGLRDYGTGTWDGGDPECEHIEPQGGPSIKQESSKGTRGLQYKGECRKCGAVRIDQQLGSEALHDCVGWATGDKCGACFICRMTAVFAEVKRVLRPDGTCWLNIGDSYNGSGGAGGDYAAGGLKDGQPRFKGRNVSTLKAKDLCLIPSRLALALQAEGWWVRSQIVWAKKAPMPESVGDRPSSAWEPIWLLTKSAKYYFDQTALAEAVSGHDQQAMFDMRTGTSAGRFLSEEGWPESRQHMQSLREQARDELATNTKRESVGSGDDQEVQQQRAGQGNEVGIQPISEGQRRQEGLGDVTRWQASGGEIPSGREAQGSTAPLLSERQGQSSNRSVSTDSEGQRIPTKRGTQAPISYEGEQHANGAAMGSDKEDLQESMRLLWGDATANEGSHNPDIEGRASRQGEHRSGVSKLQQQERQQGKSYPTARNVWTLGPDPYPEAHFATFVREIPRRAIRAGTSERGCCPACGAPWVRVREASEEYAKMLGKSYHDHSGDGVQYGLRQNGKGPASKLPAETYITTGWQPTCTCDAGDPVPCTVLDCFAGSSTTLVVAKELGRKSIGIDLSAEYLDMSIRRIQQVQPPLPLFVGTDGPRKDTEDAGQHLHDRQQVRGGERPQLDFFQEGS